MAERCEKRRFQLLTLPREFGAAMAETGEYARKAGVYPGVLREARRKYRMDWSGWDR